MKINKISIILRDTEDGKCTISYDVDPKEATTEDIMASDQPCVMIGLSILKGIAESGAMVGYTTEEELTNKDKKEEPTDSPTTPFKGMRGLK